MRAAGRGPRGLAPLLVAGLAAAALVTGACGGEDDDPDSGMDPLVPSPTLTSIQETVFTPGCAAVGPCHDASAPAGGLDLRDGVSHGALVGRAALLDETRQLVVPGEPEASFLLHKLRGPLAPSEGKLMPYNGTPLDDETILAIEEWIALGAKDD